MPVSRRRVEIAVGLFMLAGLAALLASVIFIGQQQRLFERRVRLNTSFESVEGLQSGAPVYLAGIWVGSVEQVALDAEGRVRVVLVVRQEQFHRIRRDSRARIRTAGLVGDRYIDVTVGSADSPQLAPGDTIVGIDPLDLDQVLAEAGPLFDNLGAAIENVRTVTDNLLAEESDINLTLHNLRTITETLRQGRGTLGRLLAEEAVYEDVRATAASARAVAADAEAISGELREETPALVAESREAVAKIGNAAAQTERLMTAGVDKLPPIVAGLERSLSNLEATLANLRDASEDLRATTPQLPQIVADGQKAVDETRQVLRAARAHPLLRRYVQEAAGEPAPILLHDRAQVTDGP